MYKIHIQNNIEINIAKDLEQLQQFETNFIKKGVDIELDKKTELLNDSEFGLHTIREYLSNLIENIQSIKNIDKNKNANINTEDDEENEYDVYN